MTPPLLTTPTAAARPRVSLALLTLLVALAPLSIDMFLPSLPQITNDLQTSTVYTGLTVTIFILAFGLSQLVFGPVSDRFGRRTPLLVGLWGYLLSSLICWVAPSIDVLIVARFFQGVLAGSGVVIGRAIVRDLYGLRESARIYAYLMMTVALAPILAPIVGGYVQVLSGWRLTFLILAVLGLLTAGSAQLTLQETLAAARRQPISPERILRHYARLLQDRRFVGYTLVVALLFCGQFAFISSSSFVLIDVLGVSPDVYGWCFGIAAFGLMSGSFLTSRLTPRLGLQKTIACGLLLATSAGWTMAFLSLSHVMSVAAVIAPMYFFAAGAGLVMPNASAGAMSGFPQIAGFASSLLGASQMGLSALYAIGVTAAFDQSTRPMALAIALAATLSALSFLLLVRPARSASTEAAETAAVETAEAS